MRCLGAILLGLAACGPALQATPAAARPVAHPSDGPRSNDGLSDPPPPSVGPFHLIARRQGEMWLHPMGGAVVLSAGVELIRLQAGASIQLDPRRLRGLDPPYDPQHRWTVRWAAGSWLEGVYMVDHQFFGCVNAVEGAYRWTADGWDRLNPQNGANVSAFYSDLVSFGDGVLAHREHVLSGRVRSRYACDDERLPRALKQELSVANRDAGLVALDREGRQSAAPDAELRRAVSAPDGSIYAVQAGALVRWHPDGATHRVALPPDVAAEGATVAHVSGRHVYVRVEGGLVRYSDEAWSHVSLPAGVHLLASAGGDGTSLWVSGRGTGTPGRSTSPVWELEGESWKPHALPPIAFSSDGMQDDPARLDVWQIQIPRPRVMWFLAYDPAGGPGKSALLGTVPVSEVVDVPDYEEQWRQALDVNPAAKARIDAARARWDGTAQ